MTHSSSTQSTGAPTKPKGSWAGLSQKPSLEQGSEFIWEVIQEVLEESEAMRRFSSMTAQVTAEGNLGSAALGTSGENGENVPKGCPCRGERKLGYLFTCCSPPLVVDDCS